MQTIFLYGSGSEWISCWYRFYYCMFSSKAQLCTSNCYITGWCWHLRIFLPHELSFVNRELQEVYFKIQIFHCTVIGWIWIRTCFHHCNSGSGSSNNDADLNWSDPAVLSWSQSVTVPWLQNCMKVSCTVGWLNSTYFCILDLLLVIIIRMISITCDLFSFNIRPLIGLSMGSFFKI